MFCGWDWGSTRHGICVIDDNGTVIKTWMIEHTEKGIARSSPNSPNWVIRHASRWR